MAEPRRERRRPQFALRIGAPPKGAKQSTLVLVTRRYRSKWWEVVCFGQKSHYRDDGSCVHTDEMLTRLNPEIAPPERVRVRDGRKERMPANA